MKILLSQKAKEYLIANHYKRIFMTRGKDRRISIFPEDEWIHQKEEFESMFMEEQERKAMSETFFQDHAELDLASHGYIAIVVPDWLMKWARIEDEFIIIARSTRLEIWSKGNYEPYYSGIVLEKGNLNNE